MSKAILITGSTDGIGRLAAYHLAREGHQVYIHGRNAAKVNQVVAEVQKISQNHEVKGFVADFSDLKQVNEMAQKMLHEIETLSVLVNNAGVFKSPIPSTKDGLDIRFVVNYLAPVVLTSALLPLLKKSVEPRLINLSSAAQSSISLQALAGKKSLTTQEAYAQSKLAILMWSFHQASEHAEVSTIALNPGSLLDTNMVREAFGRSWSPPDKGAKIISALCVSEQFKEVTGQYFDNDLGNFGRAHPGAYDESKVDALISQTKQIIDTILPD